MREFFNEIINHPVPLNMNILTALKRSSLGPRSLPMAGLPHLHASGSAAAHLEAKVYRQFGVAPAKADNRRTVDDFRKDCLRELKKIKLAWPELNYSTAPGRPDPLAIGPGDRSVDPTRRASPNRSEATASEKGEMKSKISIWDCRRAI